MDRIGVTIAATRPRRLAVRFLLPVFAAVTGTLITAVPWLVLTLERDQVATLVTRLEAEAREAAATLPWTQGPDLDQACTRLASLLRARVTIIGVDGTVLGESSQASRDVPNHADRPEVQEALRDGVGKAIRWSDTVDRRLLYGAWRQTRDDATRVVRIAVPISSPTEHLLRLRGPVLMGLLAAAALGTIAAWFVSRGLVRRIERLVQFAAALASGATPPPLSPERSDDLGVLEAQLADMARDIAATLGDVRVERERLEAILRGMVEGVVVTDLAGRVVLLNARARALLGVPPTTDPTGRPLIDLARTPALAELPRTLMADTATVSADIALAGGDGPSLQVTGARLTDHDGSPFGAVLVLHDVTELRRLETIRRDFVANVSHELRTPLTAIKGYAETLLGPAGNDRDTARRFLEIIDRHSERLGRLIDDLLALSDLEFGRTPLRRRPMAVESAVDDVVQMLADRAETRGVTVTAEVGPDVPPVYADGDQLRQVLINLIDNAIKYTLDGGRVVVRAARVDAPTPGVRLDIVDSGIGIPSQDLPRLTERFFRVDKARSRELGGTGLGLAIVKHIMQAHGGSLGIDSALGKGTTVHVVFPCAERDGVPEPART
jgi:two-component system phosphate regulon sensor histidine kinase PhoR